MTDARRGRFWHRAGPVAAVGVLLIGAMAEGCGGNDTGAGGAGGATSSTGANMGGKGPGSGPGGNGPGPGSGPGGGGSSGTAGSGPGSLTATQVANDATKFTNPFDATPDPAGTTIYFTGIDPTNGNPAVFKVKAGAITTVSSGDPLVAPFNIATSGVGDELYVADPGAVTATDLGVIWKLGTGTGQTPARVSGSDGLAVRGLVVNVESSTDQIYFSGVDSTSGAANVYKLKASGGTATAVITTGDTLVDPSGVAIDSNGDIYVADTVGSSTHEAQILKIHAGTAAPWVTGLKVNYPAGLALTSDDATLLVSSLDPSAATDEIIQINTGTKTQKPFTKSGTVDLTKLIEAGGMHRSVTGDVFAWVDGSAGAMNSGSVYLLQFK